jgi:hypothetical protein
MYLNDGGVIPSYLGLQSSAGASTAMMNDTVLRFGEVKKIVWPNDPKSYSKRSVEYEIQIQHRDGNNAPNTATFRGCTTSTLFGGVADRFEAILRADPNTNKPLGIGAKVLVLCLGGNQHRAIILGGIKDPQDKDIDNSDLGHNLFFEFNGLRFVVDKEGQGTVMFRGATKVDGTLSDDADAKAEGTNVSFTREGNVTIATPDDAQYIRVNHHDRKIEVLADDDHHLTSNNTITIDAQGDVGVTTQAGVNIQASNNVNIQSAGVHVGAATDAWVKGTTYRQNETTMHAQIASTLASLSTLLAAAATGLASAGTALVSPGLTAASVALTSAVPLLNTLGGYIQTFEAQAATYLSTKNLTD